MTDRAQFEAMLEALINEDQETAKEIFHNIVVGKSREIYEELLESDFPGAEDDEDDADDIDDIEDDADDADDSDEMDDSEDDSENPFDDESDDEIDDFGDEGEEDGDLEDRVLDLEDALEELKAEFEQLLAGEEGEPEHADMFGGEEDEFGGEEDEFGGEEDEFGSDLGADDSAVKEIVHHHIMHGKPQDEVEAFLEYVNKVALPKHGDNGVQTKSVIDNMKNDMGGKTIGRSSDETKGGTQGGLLNPATKPQTGGNVNVPGAKSATKLSQVSKGHGAEKKGTGEKSVNDKSLIKGR